MYYGLFYTLLWLADKPYLFGTYHLLGYSEMAEGNNLSELYKGGHMSIGKTRGFLY